MNQERMDMGFRSSQVRLLQQEISFQGGGYDVVDNAACSGRNPQRRCFNKKVADPMYEVPADLIFSQWNSSVIRQCW